MFKNRKHSEKTKKNLCVHHINYIKKDCKPDNLITVCNSSNSKANFNKWLWQEIYKK